MIDFTLCPANISFAPYAEGSRKGQKVNMVLDGVPCDAVPYVTEFRATLKTLSCCAWGTLKWFFKPEDQSGTETTFGASYSITQRYHFFAPETFTPSTGQYQYKDLWIYVEVPNACDIPANKGAWCLRGQLCLEYRITASAPWVRVAGTMDV